MAARGQQPGLKGFFREVDFSPRLFAGEATKAMDLIAKSQACLKRLAARGPVARTFCQHFVRQPNLDDGPVMWIQGECAERPWNCAGKAWGQTSEAAR